MKFSVLIAIQHAGTSLADALAALGAQIHTDWELVAADSSTGGQAEAGVRDFATRHAPVRYERVGDSGGSAGLRNRLLDLARGDAVAFLEPWDAWQPRHLSKSEPHLLAGADVVVSNARVHEPTSDRLVAELGIPHQLGTTPARTLFARDVVPSPSCVVIRRTAALASGRFDARFRSNETRDFLLRCALNGARFSLTQRSTCRCTRGRTNGAERALQYAEQTVQFYEKHRDLSAIPAALRRRLLAGSLVAHGRLLRSVDPARAARCFWRAWSLQPVHVQTLGQYALTEWRSAKPPEPPDAA